MAWLGTQMSLLLLYTVSRTQQSVKEFRVNVGDKAVLPCADHHVQHKETLSWYKELENVRILLVSVNSAGLILYSKPLLDRKILLNGSSLTIQYSREVDEGIYSCKWCTTHPHGDCNSVSRLTVLKGPRSTITKNVYIATGHSFIQPCAHHLTAVKWFFQAIGEERSLNVSYFANGTERMSLLPNASLLIRDVLGTDAGNYSCWRESSSDPDRQRLLSLTVCVLTVTADQVSPVSRGLQTVLNCSLLCGSTGDPAVLSWSHSNGSELEPGVETHINTSTGVTSLLRIRPTENTTLRCAVQVRGEERVSMEFTVHTHRDAALGNDTVLSNPSSDSLAPVLGALASCLSIVTILLLCFLCRRTAAKGNKNSVAESRAGSSRREESCDADVDMQYAVLEIRRPVRSQASSRTQDEPVYSSVYFHAHSSAA